MCRWAAEGTFTYPEEVDVPRGAADGEGGVDGRLLVVCGQGVEQPPRVTPVPILRHHLCKRRHYY